MRAACSARSRRWDRPKLTRVDDRTLAGLGYRRSDGWGIEDLSGSDWLLARAPFIRHLALVEALWLEACVAGAFRVFAVLDTGETLDLTEPAPMAGLGPRLHDGLGPAAYGRPWPASTPPPTGRTHRPRSSGTSTTSARSSAAGASPPSIRPGRPAPTSWSGWR